MVLHLNLFKQTMPYMYVIYELYNLLRFKHSLFEFEVNKFYDCMIPMIA
jgi:hypothetical protein